MSKSSGYFGSKAHANPSKNSYGNKNSMIQNSEIGSVSKRGTTGGGGGRNVQVIFNGRIATPQSLIPRKVTGVSQLPATTEKVKTLNVDKVHDSSSTAVDADGKTTGRTMSSRADKSNLISPHRPSSGTTTSTATTTMEDEYCTIILSETDTFTVLDMPSYIHITSTETPDDETLHIIERNKIYEEKKVRHSAAADSFTTHTTQTLNETQKNQNEMTSAIAAVDFECQATSYEINDEVTKFNEQFNTTDDSISPRSLNNDITSIEEKYKLPSVNKYIQDTVKSSLLTPGCLLDMNIVKKTTVNTSKSKHDKTNKKSAGGAGIGASGMNIGGSTVGASFMGGGGGNEVGASGMVRASHMGVAGASSMGASTNMITKHGVNESRGQGTSNYGMSGTSTAQQSMRASRYGGSRGVSTAMSTAADNSHSGGGGTVPVEYTFGPDPSDPSADIVLIKDSETLLREERAKNILSSPQLIHHMEMVERAVLQNIYYSKQIDYKDISKIEHKAHLNQDSLSSSLSFSASTTSIEGMLANARRQSFVASGIFSSHSHFQQKIQRLFQYRCPDIVGEREVTCMMYNPYETTLLAVGYAYPMTMNEEDQLQLEVNEESRKGGIVLFWSPRNPRFPEKVLSTPSGVTALAFSEYSPLTLAIGCQNGDLALYNLSKDEWHKPIEVSDGIHGSHTDAICQLKWITRGIDGLGEDIVSISLDGLVLLWSLKKGLTCTKLMQLKRNIIGEGWMSRLAAGLCFEFPNDDSSTYLVGTEDGQLHRCSISYNEQVIDTFNGHHGPLYKIKFSPYNSSVFLTCSADWNIHLYKTNNVQPIATFAAPNQESAINDIAWCHGNSTVFVAVTENSKIQIWDLSVSCTEPQFIYDTAIRKDDPLDEGGNSHHNTGDPSSSLSTVNEMSQKQLARVLAGAGLNPNRMTTDINISATVKLLDGIKQYTVNRGTKRGLTTCVFGPDTATLAVGDTAGYVNIYSITDPAVIDPMISMDQQKQELDDVLSTLVEPTAMMTGGGGGGHTHHHSN